MTNINLEVETVKQIQLAMMKTIAPDKRGQHFKMNGCLEATFDVSDNIPDELKIGLFREARSYKAVIRFSNGAEQDDRKPDIHGFAIKLLSVDGDKVLAEDDTREQDFILADNPLFFIRTASDYVKFMQSFAESAPKGEPPKAFIAYLQENMPEDIEVLLGFRQHTQSSPLTATYWSQVPYSFGGGEQSICRYRVRVPGAEVGAEGMAGATHDYLREVMVERLAAGNEDAVFDFEVQVKSGASKDIIDNPTVTWDEPFQKVAHIRIPAQDFDNTIRKEYGENLNYSPWQALTEHKPLGEVNEIRKAVYLSSQELRAKTVAIGRENLRLSHHELTENIDEDFKETLDSLERAFRFNSYRQGGRGTHTYGVAGRGIAHFNVSEDFPKNDYFVRGKTVPIILRHSSPGAQEDDRTRDGVAASIKFYEAEDTQYAGPGVLDILMNAGRQLFVRNIHSFNLMVHTPQEQRIELVEQGIMMDPELTEAYRIRGSFLDSWYHSWQCFEFFDSQGNLSYIRFRLIRGDRGPERGIPKAGFEANGTLIKPPLEDDSRAIDFMRREWEYQVQNSEVTYQLQAQLHKKAPDQGENPEVLNPAAAWDENRCPWMDLCEVTVNEVMEDIQAVSNLDMNPNRSPMCLKIPLATSPYHYASLGHARAIVYPGARSVRSAVPHPQNN
jgi:catalase